MFGCVEDRFGDARSFGVSVGHGYPSWSAPPRVFAQQQQPWPSWERPWEEAFQQSSSPEEDETATVLALAELLRSHGGRRPASAIGYLYGSPHDCPHRRAIKARNGVAGFVRAHPSVFALEPPLPGEKCSAIRLLTPAERLARLARAARETGPDGTRKEPCRFFQQGLCLKGAACRFSHADALTQPGATAAAGGAEPGQSREAQIRNQILFYLSDDNLRQDVFLHGTISSSPGGWIEVSVLMKFPRMEQMKADAQEVVAALAGVLEVEVFRNVGAEAVRRRLPLPGLEKAAGPQPVEHPEPSLAEQPLELLRDRGEGWEAVVEDAPRRSWCMLRRNTWPKDLLDAEFDLLRHRVEWQSLRSRKEGHVTRSTAWFVEPGCSCRYAYGDVSVEPRQKPAWLQAIEERVLGEGCGLPVSERPNSVNLNLYENDGQNVGWHSDDEGLFRGCDIDCCIISASWGAPRTFEVALKDRQHVSGRPSVFRSTSKPINLTTGDLCSMEGLFQRHYSHQLSKGYTHLQAPAGPDQVRINLTWRYIVQHKPYCPACYARD